MTPAISDSIHNKLDVTIVDLNSGGYTIERAIHGPTESNDDVRFWRNLKAPGYFGASGIENDPSYLLRTFLAHNWCDMEKFSRLLGLKEAMGSIWLWIRWKCKMFPVTQIVCQGPGNEKLGDYENHDSGIFVYFETVVETNGWANLRGSFKHGAERHRL